MAESPQNLKVEWWDVQKDYIQDHKVVFRPLWSCCPCRNAKKGRENTKDEQEWLFNVDDLPGWTKSQL